MAYSETFPTKTAHQWTFPGNQPTVQMTLLHKYKANNSFALSCDHATD